MNKFSIVLFSLLFVAVGVLYYLQLKTPEKKSAPARQIADKNKPQGTGGVRLAYIDLDSVKEHYTYFKLKNDEIEKEKMRIENEIEGGVKKLEADRVNFLKKGQSITQEEAEKFQMEYQSRYQALGQKRESLLNQHLSNQAKALDEIQKKINDYLDEYNKSEGYDLIFSTGEGNLTLYYKDEALNITQDVIKGLNETFKNEKK